MTRPRRISFCQTCIDEGNGRPLSESEARIHADNFPGHEIIAVEEKEFKEEEIVTGGGTHGRNADN